MPTQDDGPQTRDEYRAFFKGFLHAATMDQLRRGYLACLYAESSAKRLPAALEKALVFLTRPDSGRVRVEQAIADLLLNALAEDGITLVDDAASGPQKEE